MVERLSWSMVKFSGLEGGPVYIDLRQVACVTDAKAPGELAALGARVILKSGAAIYTREGAGTVFDEVHRANTQQPPAPPNMKVGEAAPAAVVPIPAPALMSQEPVYCAEIGCYTFWPANDPSRAGAHCLGGRWYCEAHPTNEEAGAATHAG